jgi:hypothetical protein
MMSARSAASQHKRATCELVWEYSPMRTPLLVVLALVGCGGAGGMDGGVDAGVDSGVDARVDAGVMDSGFVEVDAGPPPRTVFGSMTVNGMSYPLSSGYGTESLLNHQLHLGTNDAIDPRVQVTLVLPGDAGAGFSAVCGGPESVLFAARWITDAGIAFFTLNPTCAVTLSSVATAIDQDYAGTFSGTLDLEPRSVLNPGFSVMTITAGTFTVHRTF